MRRVPRQTPLGWSRSHDTIVRAAVSCAILVPAFAGQTKGESVQGLTEPYRTVEVAAAETGVIEELCVREAETVERGQRLAKLDSELLVALLAIAEQAAESKGILNSAIAELALQQERLNSYEAVFAKGHARQEEVVRARADVAVAEARLLAAREDLEKRRLEHEKVKLQIERRTIRAPMDGVVSEIHKEQGEFLATNAPSVLTLVQLNPLHAVFSLTSEQARLLRPGQEVVIGLPAPQTTAKGKVDVIAPITNPESGTVLVEIHVENPGGQYRSGERCYLELVNGALAANEELSPESTKNQPTAKNQPTENLPWKLHTTSH